MTILSEEHSFKCRKSDFTHIRHVQVKDAFAKRLIDFSYDVEPEPIPQALHCEFADEKPKTFDYEARLGINASGPGKPD